jgi:hypothetical protein
MPIVSANLIIDGSPASETSVYPRLFPHSVTQIAERGRPRVMPTEPKARVRCSRSAPRRTLFLRSSRQLTAAATAATLSLQHRPRALKPTQSIRRFSGGAVVSAAPPTSGVAALSGAARQTIIQRRCPRSRSKHRTPPWSRLNSPRSLRPGSSEAKSAGWTRTRRLDYRPSKHRINASCDRSSASDPTSRSGRPLASV